MDKHWVRFTTNHDESAWDATPINLFDGINGALAASVATVFTGGVPLIYGSQEVGTKNNIPFFSNSTVNWQANPEMLESYQQLFQFYAGSEVARKGQNTIYEDSNILAIKKSLNDQEVVIIVNLRNTMITFPIPDELEGTTWTDIVSLEAIGLSGDLSLSPYQYHILE